MSESLFHSATTHTRILVCMHTIIYINYYIAMFVVIELLRWQSLRNMLCCTATTWIATTTTIGGTTWPPFCLRLDSMQQTRYEEEEIWNRIQHHVPAIDKKLGSDDDADCTVWQKSITTIKKWNWRLWVFLSERIIIMNLGRSDDTPTGKYAALVPSLAGAYFFLFIRAKKNEPTTPSNICMHSQVWL